MNRGAEAGSQRAARFSLALLACAACSSKPEGSSSPPPAERTEVRVEPGAPATVGRSVPAPWLEGMERVATTGSGVTARVVAAGRGRLVVFGPDGAVIAEASFEGSAQVLEVIDTDGDGTAEIVLGSGRGRGALEAPIALAIYEADLGERIEEIPLAASKRAQVVSVAAWPGQPGELLVAAFESKYVVGIARVTRTENGTWTRELLRRARVVGGAAPHGDDGFAIARLYGDTADAPGDVRVYRGAAEDLLPSVRGARAIIAGSDGGTLYFADGWHKNYGEHARALVSRARIEDGGWRTEILAEVPGRHGYDRLELADTDGDGVLELICAGDGPPLRVPVVSGVPVLLGEHVATDVAVADLDGEGAKEVVVLGPKPAIWRAN